MQENKDFNIESQSQEKNWEYYERVLDGAQGLFVLDCDIQKKGKEDFEKWSSTSYTKKDAHGFLAGGHARVIAAAEIASKFPNLKLITTSRYKPEDPIHAEIYKEELERLGVPEGRIDMEVNSTSTLSSLVEMAKMSTKNEWKKVAVLTSDYHIDRVEALYSHLKELASRFNINDEEFEKSWELIKNGNLEVVLLD